MDRRRQMKSPADKYRQRKTTFEGKLKRAQKASDLTANLRLLFFLTVAALLGFGLYTEQYHYGYYALFFFIIFIWLVKRHALLKARVELLQKLVKINENALLRLAGKWTSFQETGEQFINHKHPYTTDLNIFGQGSLFQYINTTCSFTGERMLARKLSNSAPLEEIRPRQKAVMELAACLDFRQHFQAVGMEAFLKKHDPAELLSWLEVQSSAGRGKFMDYLFLLPVLTFTLLVSGLQELIPMYYFMAALIVQLAAAAGGEVLVRQVFFHTEKAAAQLKHYLELLRCLENEEFQSPFLVNLKEKLTAGSHTASRQIKILLKIVDRINLRHYNPLIYFPVNVAFLWDLHTLKKLERWRRTPELSLRTWFEVVGELEALSSLAILAHDNPDWAFPHVTDGPPRLEAKAAGHPLISRKLRVDNDISLPRPGTILLITGSNMSGKSTLLRTVGINLALAYAGAPVCAQSMSCSLQNIYTKMQVHDNLEEKVSTFYAELQRIKMIIDAAREQGSLIFLLDEIFRGTNSRDRIFATRNVLKQLQRLSAIGLVTTHDLELSVLEEEHPGYIANYHFTDKIEDGKIYFDYRLKPGVSPTANALALMKMIGIETEE